MNFQSLFDDLPPELQVYILKFLCDVEKAFFGLTCRRWYYLVQEEEPGYVLLPKRVLIYGAAINSWKIIQRVRIYDPEWAKHAMYSAARHGHVSLMDELWKCGTPEFCSSMRGIKYPDEVAERKYLRYILECSASGGHIECIKKVQDWSKEPLFWPRAAFRATLRRRFSCLKYIYEQSLLDFQKFEECHTCKRCRENSKCRKYRSMCSTLKKILNRCFGVASEYYYPEIMEWARKIGITDYITAIKAASKNGKIQSLIRIRSWGISLKKELEEYQGSLFHGKCKGLSIQEVLTIGIQSLKRLLQKTLPKNPGVWYQQEIKDSSGKVVEISQRKKITYGEFLKRKRHWRRQIHRLRQCRSFLDHWEKEE